MFRSTIISTVMDVHYLYEVICVEIEVTTISNAPTSINSKGDWNDNHGLNNRQELFFVKN
ncbi:hypothetical protein C922_05690 [Plasmodium inui San Antonio 1]|uniref:Uncharacterized protein n=1 Tax=Plasmodium inui San Antonio 1 TaxID=1237626 RepID=W6ZSN0_9APIC|nr:hypothetical protein C922_05690 [Plasmodium inui San Antonio 1]EUD63927.1 hypothetical protein C922_05690 [Plasmodium inui San Antonio 1]